MALVPHWLWHWPDAGLGPGTAPALAPVAGPYAFVLSAKTADRLRAQAAQMLAWLERHPNAAAADIAYTLQVGREAPRCRRRDVGAATMRHGWHWHWR